MSSDRVTASPDASDGAAGVDAQAVQAAGLDTSSPQSARRYDYWLGGKDNLHADRASATELQQALPSIAVSAVENRRFQHRVVRHLATEHGIQQFLDVGAGIPMSPNVHDIAQNLNPAARIVYVDHDPVVAVHARALMTSTPEGAVMFVPGDLRDPKAILSSADLHTTLDFDQPIALLLFFVLHFLEDTDHPHTVVEQLLDALPPGSCLALSHVTFDPLPPDVRQRLTAIAASGRHGQFRARTRHECARFFDGLDLIAPGLVSITDWCPDGDPPAQASAIDAVAYGAVARLP